MLHHTIVSGDSRGAVQHMNNAQYRGRGPAWKYKDTGGEGNTLCFSVRSIMIPG